MYVCKKKKKNLHTFSIDLYRAWRLNFALISIIKPTPPPPPPFPEPTADWWSLEKGRRKEEKKTEKRETEKREEKRSSREGEKGKEKKTGREGKGEKIR